MAKTSHISRRDFVTISVGLMGTIIAAVIGLPAIGYLLSPAISKQKTESWVSLGPLENYPINEPTLFSFTQARLNGWEKTVNSFGVYVLRKNQDDVITYSNVCTHLSCRVTWHPDRQLFICPCHDGQFNEQGDVVAGPPPRPLDRYENKIEDGTLFIHVEEA